MTSREQELVARALASMHHRCSVPDWNRRDVENNWHLFTPQATAAIAAYRAAAPHDVPANSQGAEAMREAAARCAEEYPSPLNDLPMALAMRSVATAIRVLPIEEADHDGSQEVARLRQALEAAAHNLEVAARWYECPGCNAAAIRARTALEDRSAGAQNAGGEGSE